MGWLKRTRGQMRANSKSPELGASPARQAALTGRVLSPTIPEELELEELELEELELELEELELDELALDEPELDAPGSSVGSPPQAVISSSGKNTYAQ